MAGASAAWLLLQWWSGDVLPGTSRDLIYAADLLAVFLILSGLAVAGLFGRYDVVRRHLLRGTGIIARWHVDPAEFTAFAAVVDRQDAKERRGALALVAGLMVLIFGAFALFDPEAGPMMLGICGAVLMLIVAAFLWGERIRHRQLQPRSGDVVISRDGALVNDVLHVWSTPVSWLRGARFDQGATSILTITYAILARYGITLVDVCTPVPPGALADAERVVRALAPHASQGSSRGLRNSPAEHP